MNRLLKLGRIKTQRLSALLGLSLDGSRMEGVEVRRQNGSVLVRHAFSVQLSLDPLTNDPILVGREIRNHLNAAGVRERRCVVGLPLKWVLTVHTTLPELPEGDVAALLQTEAERGFPCDVTTLFVASSRYRSPAGTGHATLAGVPRSHLARLEQVLHAAQLTPVSFSLDAAALQPAHAETANGVLALIVGENHVGLQATCGGGVAALRVLQGAQESEGGTHQPYADVVARETRITLGQMPPDLRDAVRRVRVFGPRARARQLADEIRLRLESAGLHVELVEQYHPGEFGVFLPAGTAVTPAVSLAVRHLLGEKPTFEFLPPKVSAWQQLADRYASRKITVGGAGAVALAVIVAGMFLIQQWQLSRLGSRWAAISQEVTELKATQDRIRQFRSWFDSSFRGLSILRQLTESFPEDGVVTAKTVEIRNLNTVTCTGVAKENQALLQTMERLRTTPGVTDLHGPTTRGRSPIQFTFDFHREEGGASAN